MAFCFLSSRLPSLRRIIYGKRLLEKEGVAEKQSINSFNEKDRMRMVGGAVREEPPIRGPRARPRLPKVPREEGAAFGKLPRERPGGSQKDGLCDTPVPPNVAHIPTIPPDFDWTRPSQRLILITRWIRRTFQSSI